MRLGGRSTSRSASSSTRSSRRWTSARPSSPVTSWTGESRWQAAVRCCAAWMTGCARKPGWPFTWPTIPWSRLRWEPASASRTLRRWDRSCCPKPGAEHVAAALGGGMGWFALHDTRRTRVVFAVLLTSALALIASDYLGGSASLRTIGGTVFGTAERAVRSVTSPLTGFFEHGASAGSSQRVQALERELIRLRSQLSSQQLSRREYAQL